MENNNIIQEKPISHIALQQSEDNKREITYIYSKLKSINNSLNTIQNQIENSGDTSGNTATSYLSSTETVLKELLRYRMHDLSLMEDEFIFKFYSPIEQIITLTCNFKVGFKFTDTTASVMKFNYYINNDHIYTKDYNYSSTPLTANCTLRFVKINSGENTLKVKILKTYPSSRFYQFETQITIKGTGIVFENNNDNLLNIVYNGQNKDLFIYSKPTNLSYSGRFIASDNLLSYNGEKYDYLRGESNIGTGIINTIEFDSRNNCYKFGNPLAYYCSVVGTGLTATDAKYNTDFMCVYSAKYAALCPTLDTDYIAKGFYITKELNASYIQFKRNTTVSVPQDITSNIPEEIDLSEINDITPVRIIDDLFLDRKLCVILSTKYNENYLLYNIESINDIKCIKLMNGGNINAYFHNFNIFYFITKNGKTYVDFLKFENNTFSSLNSSSCLGEQMQMFATSYNDWFEKVNDFTLRKISPLVDYPFTN